MSVYQPFVRRVLYPLDRWRTGDGAEVEYLKEFEGTQHLAPEELEGLRLLRLRRVVSQAYAQCPFYRQRFDACGVRPEDLRSCSDLAAFPVLQKRHLQESCDDLVSRNWPRDDLVPNRTGGSTGTPISFFVSRDRFRSRAAATWRHNRWAGFDVGDKSAMLWGAVRDAPPRTWKNRVRNLLIDRTLQLNTARITEEGLRRFHAEIRRFRPKVLVAYARSAVLFARYLTSHALEPYRFHSIITTAEVLEPVDRELLENTFGCPVFNRYGCREVSLIASECPERQGMHVMAEGLYVEVVCGDRPARPGELGAVLITDLLNLAMPLIRYQIGDMATALDGACPCGRGLPRLDRVAGRTSDFLVGRDGRLVSGTALTVAIVAKRPSLGQVQIWQDRPGCVLYKIAAGEGRRPLPEDLSFLEEETKHYLGADSQVEYELVEELPTEPSGKYLFCRSSATCDFLDLART